MAQTIGPRDANSLMILLSAVTFLCASAGSALLFVGAAFGRVPRFRRDGNACLRSLPMRRFPSNVIRGMTSSRRCTVDPPHNENTMQLIARHSRFPMPR